MTSREINKLKKRRSQILSQEYETLSDRRREISWSQLANIDFRLKQLKTPL